MQSYTINQGKRKEAMKQIVKAYVKHAKGFVKFCYGLTWFLRLLAIVLGVLNVIYVAVGGDPLYLIFLILTFVFPYGFSFIPATVYIVSADREYKFRKGETIVFEDRGFVYSYHDDRIVMSATLFVFQVAYANVCKYDYDDKTKILTLDGKFVGYIYENGEQKENCEVNEISLLDVYDFSLKNLLDENC